MITRVFSTQLDPRKAWYALNDNLCVIPPRKFCANGIFDLFPEEVCRVNNIDDLRSENGGLVPLASFNRGARGSDAIYAGTAFAVLAGNLRRKDPCEGEFFKSSLFECLRMAVNNAEQFASTNECQSSSSSQISLDNSSNRSADLMENLSNQSTKASSLSSLAEDYDPDVVANHCPKSPPNTVESPPRCSTPASSSFSSTESSPSTSSSPDLSVSSISEIESSSLGPVTKKRKIRKKVETVMGDIGNVCAEYGETLSEMIAQCCLFQRKDSFCGKNIVRDVFERVEQQQGVRKTCEELIPEELWQKRVDEMCVPDWLLLLCKLESRISDDGWQTILNRTRLGKSGNSSDTPILLTKNSMKALKAMVFRNVQEMLEITPTEDSDIPGFQVALEPIVKWLIRELRLHGQLNDQDILDLLLKLDGRPFCARNQVLLGVVPKNTPFLSNQSCKSVCPLAIANCKEDRESLKKLIVNINNQKDILKKNGIVVDGKRYKVDFKVILDLKGLYLLLARDDDENFKLAIKGLEVEFCFICHAIRGCSCDLGPHTVCLEHFAMSKANIGSFKGIRDDLTFLLEEDLSSINVCALHCELRNTEQLLRSLGLFAHRVGSLPECNEELSRYGPENFNSRITVKLKEGQETAVERHNIQVTSFSGNTERQFLANIETIVRNSLPHEKLKTYYQDPEAAKHALLNKVTFCSEQIKYYEEMISANKFTRDFGTKQEEIILSGSEVGKEVQSRLGIWRSKLTEIEQKYEELHAGLNSQPKRGKNKTKTKAKANADSNCSQLAEYAARLVFHFVSKVFTGWKDIAEVIRNGVFKEDEQHLIDIFDIQCKEWGFLLREMFGNQLGTGDYGHITIEHASMFMRNFLSLKEYSNQGFEAAHSLQRQLFSRATSHDRHGYASSIGQMLQHFFTEKMMFLRLCFRMAVECVETGKPFHFRGCGWPQSNKEVRWSLDDANWISAVDNLFTKTFGEDFLVYKWDKALKSVIISPESIPAFNCDRNTWEDALKLLSPSAESDSTGAPNTFVSSSNSGVPLKGGDDLDLDQVLPTTSSKIVSLPSNKVSSYSTGLRACTNEAATRCHLALLNLPPVVQFQDDEVELVIDARRLSNPLVLGIRPSESTIRKCQELISQATDEDDEPDVALKLGNQGVFHKHALKIWQRALLATDLKHKVTEEGQWLSKSCALTASQSEEVASLLLNSKPQEEVLRFGNIIIDVNDVSTLVGERYLTGFVIDGACLKYCEEAQASGAQSLFLPSLVQTWASSGDCNFLCSKLKPFISSRVQNQIQWLLTPILVNNNHWGLLCLNMVSSQAYFDDGLKVNPPVNICAIIQILSEAVNLALPNLQQPKWDVPPIQRFGMPLQPLTGEGCGSCGMGVILAGKDFLSSGARIPSFSWCFQEMTKHRQHLLHQFVQWKQ